MLSKFDKADFKIISIRQRDANVQAVPKKAPKKKAMIKFAIFFKFRKFCI